MIEEMKREFEEKFYLWKQLRIDGTFESCNNEVWNWIESKIEDAKRQAKIEECKYWQDAIFSPQSIIAQLSVIDFQLRITELSLPESPEEKL